MNRFLIGFALTLVASCGPSIRTETQVVPPTVPDELRQPVGVPSRPAPRTLVEVGVVLTDHVEALGRANGQIVAIDCILTAAEAGEEPQCLAAAN